MSWLRLSFRNLFRFPPVLTGDRTHFTQHSVTISGSPHDLAKTLLGFYLTYFFSNILSFLYARNHFGKLFSRRRWKTKLSLCEALRFVAFHSAALERIFSNSLNATFCIIFNWREFYVKIIFSKKLGMQLNIFKQEFCARPWGPLIY